MRREVRGKRVILTGASSGIGNALARQFAEAGAKLALVARSADKLTAIATDLRSRGADVIAAPGDVTQPDDREYVVSTAVARWGGLDLLVNNAGVAAWGHFQSSTEIINRVTMEVNFFGPVELIRLAVPYLMDGDQPAVVNITSMCGRRGMPAWPEYSASKFALVGMSEALRGELARFGIDVVTIVPGLTNSDLNRHLLRNEGRADIRYETGMTPGYVAGRIVKAIRNNSREVVLGREARLMLLANRFFPRLVNRLIAHKVTKLYR
jgi:short-subunit dehydrogenase